MDLREEILKLEWESHNRRMGRPLDYRLKPEEKDEESLSEEDKDRIAKAIIDNIRSNK